MPKQGNAEGRGERYGYSPGLGTVVLGCGVCWRDAVLRHGGPVPGQATACRCAVHGWVPGRPRTALLRLRSRVASGGKHIWELDSYPLAFF